MKKLLLLSLIAFNLNAQQIISDRIQTDIRYLASDRLQGREPGTPGEAQAASYITKTFESLKLAAKGDTGYRQEFTYKTRKNPHDTDYTGGEKHGTNIIAYLDNHQPYTLVIGGHYDHLGKEGHTSSLDKDKQQIHNGADDNASGTAGVLELARYYSNNNITEKANILFICFSGEEDGLIGSKYFCNHPTLDLNSISCMINMDMIGRLNDSTKKLMIYGIGTSPAYTAIFGAVPSPFHLVYDSSGIGPSDQTSFYLKNIPVLHFFTGQHSDYHKSTDDSEKINVAGEQSVLMYITSIADQIMAQGKIVFTPTKNQEQTKVSFKVTLGIMPDYSFEGKGVRIDAATEGKPAAKAGLQAGDIIIRMGELEISNMMGYMKALNNYNKGDHASIHFLRDGKEQQTEVTF